MTVLLLATVLSAWALEGGPPPVVLGEDKDPEPLPPAFAHEATGWGAGILLGLPTGLSAAYRPGGRVWYDLALAWSFDRNTVGIHGDAILTLADLRTDDIPDMRFPVWLGIGPRFRLGDTPETPGDGALTLGIRVPIGMSFIHDGMPLEAFLELAPGIGLFPTTFPLFDVAVGGRYYFGKAAKAP